MAIKRCWAVFHNNPETVQSSSIGYSLVGKKGIEQVYIDESIAIDVANELAAKHPGTQVVLLEAKLIVEAKIPDTIAKAWKDNGELIPIERPVLKDKSKKIRFDPLDAVARQMHDDYIETQRVRAGPAQRRPQPAHAVRIDNPFNAILDDGTEPPAPPPPERGRGF